MDPVEILKQLVAIPSVNPMGRALEGSIYFETAMSDYLMRFFAELGVPHERLIVVPGRANVIAKCVGEPNAPTVLIDAHQDTVPVDGMTIEPFTPVVRDGRLYGRGSADVKGGMAAMLAAFARLVKEQPNGSATVIMSCTCDEEATLLGVNDLVKLWSDPLDQRSQVLTERPAMSIVAEPTDLDIVVAHRGATRWKIRTTGRACHSSKPSAGVNAIYRMAPILTALRDYAKHLEHETPAHPLCGPATLSVGIIQGGSSVNTVPDECLIEIDRRVIPGEDGLQVMHDVEQYLRENVDVEFEMLPNWLTGLTLPDTDNGPLASQLMESIEAVAGPHRKVGVPYGTHASRIALAGVPSVVFGPGSIQQAHTKDEWLPIDELHQATEILYRFLSRS